MRGLRSLQVLAVFLTVLFLVVVLLCSFKVFVDSSEKDPPMARMSVDRGVHVLKNLDFEVFGRVQGVFFRKHTMKTATKYGLVGWVQNTRQNTVVGQAQGPSEKLNMLKEWLQKTGSPKSIIDRAEFRNEKIIDNLSFQNFKIIR
ncbi:acylphosphatase-2-like isoform X1 [Apostichopus japonicus]|uniref:acylphosphatase-2-like isoform X1 n=1 Tax=Stichopus japonicus TaxID=307972 RepID=UPI003AB1B40A